MKYKDLTNQKFGHLTVLRRFPNHAGTKQTKGRARWKCKCSCGKEVDMLAQSLLTGNSKSCGCRKRKDLMDQRFGKLIAVEKKGKDRRGNAIWVCKCDCGKEKEIIGCNLTGGRSTSCGCKSADTKTRLGTHPTPKNKLSSGESVKNSIYRQYKYSAKARKLEFKLTMKECERLFKSNCYYCNANPSNIKDCSINSTNGTYTYNGIDRVNNDLGYALNNVVSCCIMCNRMKRTYSKSDFLQHIKYIYQWSVKNEGIS